MDAITNTDSIPVTYPMFTIGPDGRRRLNDVSPAQYFQGQAVDPESVVPAERPWTVWRGPGADLDPTAGWPIYRMARYGGGDPVPGRAPYAPRLNPASPREWYNGRPVDDDASAARILRLVR